MTDKPVSAEWEKPAGWVTVGSAPSLPPIPPPHTIPVVDQQRALWMAIRQALLMAVDAIEVYLQLETRTAELRKRLK